MRLGRILNNEAFPLHLRSPRFVKTPYSPKQPVYQLALRCLPATCASFVAVALRAADAVEAAAAEEPVTMESFQVAAEPVESKNYKVEHNLTATKTNTPLLNVPQSITIVTEQQIKDQQMLSLGDVVRYVPGITAIQGENNRDQIVFRGTSSTRDSVSTNDGRGRSRTTVDVEEGIHIRVFGTVKRIG